MRKLFVILLFSFVAIGVNDAFAQTKTIDFSTRPTAIKEVIEAIADDTLIIYDSAIPEAIWSTPLDVSSVATLEGKIRTMNLILRDHNLEAKEASGRRILIIQKTTANATINEQNSQPVFGNKASWQAWFDNASQAEREAYRMRRSQPGYNPCTYGDNGCLISPYGYASGLPTPEHLSTIPELENRQAWGMVPRAIGTGNYHWMPDPFLWKFFQNEHNRAIYGVLKIDNGDDDIEVVIDGASKGVTTKYNNRREGAIIVRVKDSPSDLDSKILKVDFILRSPGKPERRVTKNVRIEPYSVTGFDNAMWQRITKEDFRLIK